jgi:hypothetical protein
MHIGDWIFILLILASIIQKIIITIRTYLLLAKKESVYKINNYIGRTGFIFIVLGLYLLMKNLYLFHGFFRYNLRGTVYGVACILFGISFYDYSSITNNGIILRGRLIKWSSIQNWYWNGEKYISFEFFKRKDKSGGLKLSRLDMLVYKRNGLEVEKVLKRYIGDIFKEVLN